MYEHAEVEKQNKKKVCQFEWLFNRVAAAVCWCCSITDHSILLLLLYDIFYNLIGGNMYDVVIVAADNILLYSL